MHFRRLDLTPRLVFHIFAALAEFGRELIAERAAVGRAAARARGRLGGRPAKLSPEQASFRRPLNRRPLNRLPGRQPRWRTSTSTAPPMSS